MRTTSTGRQRPRHLPRCRHHGHARDDCPARGVLRGAVRGHRPTILIWVPLAAITVLCWRLFYRRVFARAIFAGRILLVADADIVDRVWAEVDEQMAGLYRVVGTIHPGTPMPGLAWRPRRTMHDADQIVLGAEEDLPDRSFPGPRRLLRPRHVRAIGRRRLRGVDRSPARRAAAPDVAAVPAAAWRDLTRVRALQTARRHRGRPDRAWCSSRILLPFVWVAIKLEDRGPIFHRQVRVGHFGKPFEILKLRTDACASARGVAMDRRGRCADHEGRRGAPPPAS